MKMSESTAARDFIFDCLINTRCVKNSALWYFREPRRSIFTNSVRATRWNYGNSHSNSTIFVILSWNFNSLL